MDDIIRSCICYKGKRGETKLVEITNTHKLNDRCMAIKVVFAIFVRLFCVFHHCLYNLLTGMCSIGRCWRVEPVPIGFAPICGDFPMASLHQRSIGSIEFRCWLADAMWCVSMRCATFSFDGRCSFDFGLIDHQRQLVMHARLQ